MWGGKKKQVIGSKTINISKLIVLVLSLLL